MSLGLPSHLAPQTVSRSYARALHAVGMTFIVAAATLALVYQAAYPEAVLWPAIVAVLPMGALLWLTNRSRTAFLSAAYLIVGAACTYWYILTFYSQVVPITVNDAFTYSFLKVALVLVGGSGTGLVLRLTWCVLGYLAATVASGIAITQSGHEIFLDVTTLVALVVAGGVVVISEVGQRRYRRTQPLIHRAARDEQLAAMRHQIEVKAAALMHDTVLSHLAAVAGAPRDDLDPALRDRMARDLETLIGQEWLSEASREADAASRADWRQSGLFAAIQEMRDAGLEVDSTGDLSSVTRLDRESSIALGLAVKQCLVNVLRHSGTTRAEVAVYGADAEVSVMVIDAGKGFQIDEMGADRLGLRHSVRRRVEGVGGSVQVWSTPGRGTSIMIRIPAALRYEEGRPAEGLGSEGTGSEGSGSEGAER